MATTNKVEVTGEALETFFKKAKLDATFQDKTLMELVITLRGTKYLIQAHGSYSSGLKVLRIRDWTERTVHRITYVFADQPVVEDLDDYGKALDRQSKLRDQPGISYSDVKIEDVTLAIAADGSVMGLAEKFD